MTILTAGRVCLALRRRLDLAPILPSIWHSDASCAARWPALGSPSGLLGSEAGSPLTNRLAALAADRHKVRKPVEPAARPDRWKRQSRCFEAGGISSVSTSQDFRPSSISTGTAPPHHLRHAARASHFCFRCCGVIIAPEGGWGTIFEIGHQLIEMRRKKFDPNCPIAFIDDGALWMRSTAG